METRSERKKWAIFTVAITVVLVTALYIGLNRTQPNTILQPNYSSRSNIPQLPIATGDTDQKSLVETLISHGNYDRALVEAKSYYNVVPLKLTSDAVKLVALALVKTRGGGDPSIEARFIDEQRVGALTRPAIPSTLPQKGSSQSVLQSITVDRHRYDYEIQKLKAGTTYQELMSLGDLLLLADEPIEARRAFIAAFNTTGIVEKHLIDAMEGVARATRAEAGITGPANALLVDLMLGRQSKATLQDISTESWDRGDVQFAAQRVTLNQLSENILSEQSIGHEAAATTDDKHAQADNVMADLETFVLDDPLIIAAMSSERDVELVDWLRGAQKTFRANLPVAKAEQVRLKAILEHTKLPSLILLQIAHAYQFRSIEQNRATISLFYAAAAKQIESELNEYGHSPQAIIVLRGMKDHMGGYKSVLWPLINAGDKDAALTLYSIYANYTKWTPADDRSLLKQLTHAKIGAAECLYKLRRYVEAQAILQELDPLKMEKGERQVFHWASGMVLSGLRRYTEALPHLEITSQDKNYQYCRDAWKLRFNALLELGRTDEAREASTAYAQLYGDDKISEYMIAALERARLVRLQREATGIRPQTP